MIKLDLKVRKNDETKSRQTHISFDEVGSTVTQPITRV